MTPGEYLRTARKKAGKTLYDVSARFSLSVPYLSDIERGRRAVPRMRAELCAYLGADVLELERLEVVSEGRIDISMLSPVDRIKVHRLVAELRAA